MRSHVHIDVCDDWRVMASPTAALNLYPDPRLALLGYRGLVPAATAGDHTEAAWRTWRYTHGIAEGSFEIIPDKTIPLEYNYDYLNAISWTKGCYLGQELTARTRYVGQVRKRLMLIQCAQPLAPGDILYKGDASVGEVKVQEGNVGWAVTLSTPTGVEVIAQVPLWLRGVWNDHDNA